MKPFRCLNLCYVLSGIVIIHSGCNQSPRSEAEDALATFELEPGFKIELLASEPLLGDPVDMEIDEYGRLYVVEMPGYPLDKTGSGKIKLLSDTNGDGRMDKSTLFAEGLILPNSIMRWKNGMLVTDAPHVLYLEDTNNDGHADVKDTLLTGFALSNPQHNLNSPLLGIDNWIYLAHEGAVSTETYQNEFGDPGQEIHFPQHPDSPRLAVNAGGRAVRFHPDKLQLEMLSGHTQFGHTFDAWGHHFLVGNANHLFHEVIAEPYLKRNRSLLLSEATQSLPDHGDAAEVFPITQNPQHQLLTDVGVITSACGLTAYLGGAFPPPYDGNITFVAEPVSNLIHVDHLRDSGATFVASRVKPHREFLASTDFRFRPVNMYVGPDGALYIVDYYRQVIEHPEWMGEEVIKSGELYNDMDKGRIYRVTADNSKAEWTRGLSLGKASLSELVEKLASPNIWWRQNAQRLLIERKNKQAVSLLTKMSEHPTSALGRLHALWTLEGMGELQAEAISQALKDQSGGVRENAIRLAELHLSAPQLINDLFALQNDPDKKVRYQLLCTLGFIQTREAARIRNELLLKNIADPWMQVAALTGSSGRESVLLSWMLANFNADVPAYGSLLEQLSSMMGVREEPGVLRSMIRNAIVHKGPQQAWQAPLLDGLAKGLERRSAPASFAGEQTLLISTFFDHPSAAVRKACLRLLKTMKITNEAKIQIPMKTALTISTDSSQQEQKRAESIDFLGLVNPGKYSTALYPILFSPDEPLSVQLAALRSLRRTEGTTICLKLLEYWEAVTPELKEAAVRVFLSGEDRMKVLLDALESGKMKATDVVWPSQVYLMAQSDDSLRSRARAIFTANSDKEINKAWKESLLLKGDEVKGKEIYAKHCALCHQVRGKMGISLGPDLGTVHNWSPDAILSNILSPGASISSGYDLWEVELKNGESFQGIIATETPGALTFVNAGSSERTFNRNDVRALKTLNMSIMPAQWEKVIGKQEMADLLAFLKQNK